MLLRTRGGRRVEPRVFPSILSVVMTKSSTSLVFGSGLVLLKLDEVVVVVVELLVAKLEDADSAVLSVEEEMAFCRIRETRLDSNSFPPPEEARLLETT